MISAHNIRHRPIQSTKTAFCQVVRIWYDYKCSDKKIQPHSGHLPNLVTLHDAENRQSKIRQVVLCIAMHVCKIVTDGTACQYLK
jgi:hypothetical protein